MPEGPRTSTWPLQGKGDSHHYCRAVRVLELCRSPQTLYGGSSSACCKTAPTRLLLLVSCIVSACLALTSRRQLRHASAYLQSTTRRAPLVHAQQSEPAGLLAALTGAVLRCTAAGVGTSLSGQAEDPPGLWGTCVLQSCDMSECLRQWSSQQTQLGQYPAPAEAGSNSSLLLLV